MGRHSIILVSSLPIVAVSSGDDSGIGSGLGVLDVALAAVEGRPVDDGAHKGVRLLDVAELEGLLGLDQALLDLGPEGLGHVHPGAGGALLSGVLEGRPDGGGHDGLDLGRGVDEVVVLAAALTDQAGETSVVVQVLTHGSPQPLEGAAKIHIVVIERDSVNCICYLRD